MKLNKLFKKECNSIIIFKIGDIITRGESMKRISKIYNKNLMIGQEIENGYDMSYIGDPFEYLGIYNNQIYLRHVATYFKGSVLRLNIDEWCEGWIKFELPNGVTMDEL